MFTLRSKRGWKLKNRRLRDPIHGLITFDREVPTDVAACQLIDTPEFQRLRRIKQLGVSEFVYPGATHSRFSHSIGVFCNARKMIEKVKGLLGDDAEQVEHRSKVILLAALLHDVGHGPFSHAFESAGELLESKFATPYQNHEKFSSDIILNPNGAIYPLLEAFHQGLPQSIAELLRAETPTDFFHAIVSSSFDADRLDYLVRDRYMTGTEAGAIDIDWLFNNIKLHQVDISKPDEDDDLFVNTIAFQQTAQQAAEDFLLARYRLYDQVYLHRVTRGFEQVLKALIFRIAEVSLGQTELSLGQLGLNEDHPLVQFFIDEEKLAHYLRLDDAVLWGAFESVGRGEDQIARTLAERLRNRGKIKSIDLRSRFDHLSGDPLKEATVNATVNLETHFRDKMDRSVFLDDPKLNLYGKIGDSADKEHKKIRVVVGNHAKEITELNRTVISKELLEKQKIGRFYFLDAADHEEAIAVLGG